MRERLCALGPTVTQTVRWRACWHSTLPPDNRRLLALDVEGKAQEANYQDASGTAVQSYRYRPHIAVIYGQQTLLFQVSGSNLLL
jgi:hypothetical protein